MIDNKRLDELDRLRGHVDEGKCDPVILQFKGGESTPGVALDLGDGDAILFEIILRDAKGKEIDDKYRLADEAAYFSALRNSAREMIRTIRTQRAKIEKLERRIADIYADQRDAAWERDISD